MACKHTAEALALSCIDYRLVDATVTQLEAGSSAPFDYMALAGASLYVNRPERPEWRTTFFQTSYLASELHKIKGIVVVQHQDCGAFRVAYPELVNPETGHIPIKIEKKLAIENLKALKRVLEVTKDDLYFRGYFIYLDGKLEQVV